MLKELTQVFFLTSKMNFKVILVLAVVIVAVVAMPQQNNDRTPTARLRDDWNAWKQTIVALMGHLSLAKINGLFVDAAHALVNNNTV